MAILLGVALSAPLATFGQPLSLYDAWQLALQNEPGWRASKAAIDIDAEEENKAFAGLLPTVGLSSQFSQNRLDRTPGTQVDYSANSTSLLVRQPLLRWQNVAEWQRSKRHKEVTAHLVAGQGQDLANRVAHAYFQTLLAGDALRLAGIRENSLRTQLAASERSHKAGSGTRIEIDEARARLALATTQKLAAKNELDNARRALGELVGRTVDALVPLDHQRIGSLPLAPASRDEWLVLAKTGNPLVNAAARSVDEAVAGIDKARAGHYPTIDLVASHTRAESDSVSTVSSKYTNSTIGVQLNVPLFAGFYTSADTAQARARHRRSIDEQERMERELSVNVVREYNGVMSGREKLGAFETALAASREALQSTRRGFASGSRTSLDVLNAETDLHGIRLELARARYELVLGHMRLEALSGRLDEAGIQRFSNLLNPTAIPPEIEAAEQETSVSVLLPGASALARAETPQAPVTTAPRAVPAPPEPTAATPGASGGARLVVHAGVFKFPQNAARVAEAARKAGLPVQTEKQANGLTRVSIGPFARRDEAETALRRLREAGFPGSIATR